MVDVNELLNAAAESVLENMFFSAVMGELPGEPDDSRVCAAVTFAGSNEGELVIAAAPATLEALAAGFLGADEESVADSQVKSVAGELANVLCGAVLGGLDPKGSFQISPPRIVEAVGGGSVCDMAFQKRFELMEGDL